MEESVKAPKEEMVHRKENGWIAAFKFVPLLIFAVAVIVFKLDLLLAAPIATFSAVAVYMILYKADFEDAFEQCLRSVKRIVLIFFILMFAYGVAECFMATGVGAALINLALEVGVTARTIAPVTLIVTCLLSTATGSSWGTFAACAPIFLWLNHLVGGNNLLTLCSIAGGSCFGDNIGMTSDVTVLSCGMQDVKIIDRLKHQLIWAFGSLAKLVVKISKNVQQLMGWCGVLCLAGNAALSDEAAQVATMSPIIRDIVEKNVECEDDEAVYTLRVRLATFTSGMGIYGSQMIPWHCFPVFFAGIASAVFPLATFTPVDIIGHNYLSFIIVGSLLILTFTGLDRFVPMLKLPSKDRIRLKKN